MSFRDFVTNFKYRRKMAADFENWQNLKPPKNPSRRYIDKLVKKLLDEKAGYQARRELEMIGAAAAPALAKALDDPRYHRAQWEPFSTTPTPLCATLGLLVGHENDKVVQVASRLAKSEITEVRKTAAMHLASVGRCETMPILCELMQDEDGYVRSYVRMGIHSAATEGRADAEFRVQAYELLLSQCDQEWRIARNQAACTMIVLDRERATSDLANERFLKLDNRNTSTIIKACNEEKIGLPQAILRQLVDEALPQCVGERCYFKVRIVSESLENLALQRADGVQAIADSLLSHDHEDLRVAAGKALSTLAGAGDPWKIVIERIREAGYQTLSPPQKVYYCAQNFDYEVCNGGLMQYFANGGEEVADTLSSLVELGHGPSVATLADAIRIVGPLARDPDRELRLTAFEGKWDDFKAAFRSLETDYYAKHSGLRQALLLYAARHAEHFRALP